MWPIIASFLILTTEYLYTFNFNERICMDTTTINEPTEVDAGEPTQVDLDKPMQVITSEFDNMSVGELMDFIRRYIESHASFQDDNESFAEWIRSLSMFANLMRQCNCYVFAAHHSDPEKASKARVEANDYAHFLPMPSQWTKAIYALRDKLCSGARMATDFFAGLATHLDDAIEGSTCGVDKPTKRKQPDHGFIGTMNVHYRGLSN